MKKLLIPVLAALMITACNNNETKEVADAPKTDSLPKLEYFGDTISAEGAVPATELEKHFNGKDSVNIKLTGKIADVCQKKGCWMQLEMGNDKTIRVEFLDYAFFVPKDAGGKMATVEGYAFTDTISVAQLKHLADDAGKSKEEIEAIKEPEITTSFMAKGVIIHQ